MSGALPGLAEGEPTVWVAEPGPQPHFDPAVLGRDRSFVPRTLEVEAVEGTGGAVVHLGDLDGEPVLVFAEEAPRRNPWDYVYAFFMGHGDRRIFCASFGCRVGVDTIDEEAGSFVVGAGLVQWLAVPAGTSVVAFEFDGAPYGYQRPAGRIPASDPGGNGA